jgi:hypothetical protein
MASQDEPNSTRGILISLFGIYGNSTRGILTGGGDELLRVHLIRGTKSLISKGRFNRPSAFLGSQKDRGRGYAAAPINKAPGRGLIRPRVDSPECAKLAMTSQFKVSYPDIPGQ